MNIILLTIGILLTVEFGMIMFCGYWRENNPWKWFFIKLLTTVSIITMICWGKETYEIYELITVALFGIAVGIDFAHAHITSNNSKMID